MLLQAKITEKSFGAKVLFRDLEVAISEGEKVGLIGRNGVGKTTLFGILTGRDKDFTGEIIQRRGTILVATAQEYHAARGQTVLEYILGGLPEYLELSRVIEGFAETENPTGRAVAEYSEAVERFSRKGYYFVAERVAEEMKNFQLEGLAEREFSSLSGGQKRMSEIVKIMHSQAQVALIDEPTNYMDFAAKQQFIDWMKGATEAILVITHDRDVLREVDRIIEIRDGGAVNFRGNYDFYLRENAARTGSAMTAYEILERRRVNLRQKVIEYQRLKERARDPGTIRQFKRLETRARAELAAVEAEERPSFWIDKESVEGLGYKDSGRYEKFKARNLRLGIEAAEARGQRVLARARDLAVGYEAALFSGVNFELREGECLELRGRNGAGKTTLVRALLGAAGPTVYEGEVSLDQSAKVGLYEQEVDTRYFDLSLPAAVEKIYLDRKLAISEQKVRQLMGDYLFTKADQSVLVRNLSGGQKARLQIIAMLAGEPNLLVLDEPTAHLDLPSIEELEGALARYRGAILYISHDGYFRRRLGGVVVEI